ncbi:DNA polymerase III [Treponema sp. Marseille-Q3903]|uniref:DNA polymerase III n=1 Tax=Treponema sp. Marseille-Q3903 TaxID=2766703 RepID=UPI001651F2D3|nr:DNA polymerase III [Treponema sp. Marseille-Q3903]MBC6713474.1 DNA polymerase III [Treponema sp. Marseille-Q3903]
MFENLCNQDAGNALLSDIKNDRFPRAVLFSGNEASGKLTAALETARIISCRQHPFGKWTCNCKSCSQHKALICSNLMILGPRDCSLEINAAKDTFLNAIKQNVPYIDAARYLFLRSIRKLTLRFNPIIWNDDKDLSKIGSIMQEINENIEELDFPHNLPNFFEVEKLSFDIAKLAFKLENDYFYDSIPISHIRNMETWANIKCDEGKKTVIIENADRMQVNVRNALLKTLEEPPEGCVFILLSSKRNSIIPTILSRVRTYNFKERTLEQQQDVIKRVFHNDYFNGSINDYLLTFLPVPPAEIKNQAEYFYKSIARHQIPDVAEIVKNCGNFTPRLELRLFLHYLAVMQKKLLYSQNGVEASAQCMELLRNCWDNITLYNQTPVASLEILLRNMSSLNVANGGVFCVDM